MLILVIRTLILYLTVIFSMRIMGKRQLGELQPSELVVAIMISDLASVPMQTIDIPLLAGIIPVITLVVAEICMSYASMKSKGVRRFFSGEPSMIIYNGHINEHELERLRFNINDLLEELRTSGYYNIADVAIAVLETNGKLSVIPKSYAKEVTLGDINNQILSKEILPYIIVSDGTINPDEILRWGKSVEEAKDFLKHNGIDRMKDILIASVDADEQLYVQKKGQKDKTSDGTGGHFS